LFKIALCDDIPILRQLLEMMIHEYEIENKVQFRIYHFCSGEEILEKYREGHISFDLLFLDYYMKKLTGIKTALCIRKYDKSSNIIFVTASDAEHEFMAATPLAILRKPVTKECIFEVLDKFLAERRQWSASD
jgi:CheY-like chemotaxis protein